MPWRGAHANNLDFYNSTTDTTMFDGYTVPPFSLLLLLPICNLMVFILPVLLVVFLLISTRALRGREVDLVDPIPLQPSHGQHKIARPSQQLIKSMPPEHGDNNGEVDISQ